MYGVMLQQFLKKQDKQPKTNEVKMWLSFVMLVSVILLNIMYTSASEIISQPDPLMIVSVGDNVTLHCFIFKGHSDPIVWYKQTSGQQLYMIAVVQQFVETPNKFSNHLKSQRFTTDNGTEVCHLKISNVTASDEAMYYCGLKKFVEVVFGGGTYLTLKGSQHNQYKSSVSVVQQPVSASVHPGDTVTLLCSVLSERTTADIRMFWFRSDSEKSQIIYTRNQSEIDSATQSCSYNLSKDIINQTDTGMYYCAVITCGKILFGNGTNINIVKPVESIVIILGGLLGVCVIVITAQAVSNHKKERYYYKRANVHTIDKEHHSSQDCDGMDLHYAAPHFKEGKNRRLRRTEAPQDSVYSQLNNLSVIDQHN